MSGGAKLQVRVAEVVEVNELIKRFRFVTRDGSALPAFSGGAHTVVEMDDHGTRRLNPYSLMSDPEDRTGYEISVRRDDVGRGLQGQRQHCHGGRDQLRDDRSQR